MFRQEITSQGPSQYIQETYIVNNMQIDAAHAMGIDITSFIEKYAEKFREEFEKNPEWRDLFLRDRTLLTTKVVEVLSRTIH
jgi:hypothetical protein